MVLDALTLAGAGDSLQGGLQSHYQCGESKLPIKIPLLDRIVLR